MINWKGFSQKTSVIFMNVMTFIMFGLATQIESMSYYFTHFVVQVKGIRKDTPAFGLSLLPPLKYLRNKYF